MVPGGWLTPCPILVPVIHVIHVPDYLTVGPGLVPGDWAVVPGMYGTHLKNGQCLNRSVSIT